MEAGLDHLNRSSLDMKRSMRVVGLRADETRTCTVRALHGMLLSKERVGEIIAPFFAHRFESKDGLDWQSRNDLLKYDLFFNVDFF
ncbi:hypothetical protein Syun_015251 [Stephania yunnanensis]|uniref:Uncharacterized protein n=1 Tax=Stephania yunnanensis TaxID=152371 RepID=A0AAP0JKT2_9MAGN